MMNMKSILSLVIASLIITGDNIYAQLTQDTYQQHSLTIALSLTVTGDSVEKPNGNGFTEKRKISTVKLSNKEILQSLIDENSYVADQMGHTIKGWSIVMITDSSAEIVAIWIVKKNMNAITLNAYFDIEMGPVIEGYQGKYDAIKNLYASKKQATGLSQLELDLYQFHTEMEGISKVVSYYTDQDEGSEIEFIKTADFTNLSGGFGENSEDFEGVVAGAVKAGIGKVISF